MAAGIALVLGGVVGGIVSALSSGGGILKSALIGGLIGLGFFLGAAALTALNLTGFVLLAGGMLLGVLIGVVVNLATGQPLDKGLLANLLLAGLLHKFSRWVKSKRTAGTDKSNSTQQPRPDEPVTKPDGPEATWTSLGQRGRTWGQAGQAGQRAGARGAEGAAGGLRPQESNRRRAKGRLQNPPSPTTTREHLQPHPQAPPRNSSATPSLHATP